MDLVEFDSFLTQRVRNIPEPLDPMFLQLAAEIKTGTNVFGEVPVSNSVAQLREKFCSSCLGLASNTQGTERGVKEAKLVSATGKREEMRSILVIIRSALQSVTDGTEGKQKAKKVIQYVLLQHQRQVDKQSEADLQSRSHVHLALQSDHFKNVRMAAKRQTIASQNSN